MPLQFDRNFTADEPPIIRDIAAPTPSSGSSGTGDLASSTDPTTGSDGSGTGALAPQIAPTIVIGLNLARRGADVDGSGELLPQVDTPLRSLEAMSQDRRRRSMYTERKPRPTISGINL